MGASSNKQIKANLRSPMPAKKKENKLTSMLLKLIYKYFLAFFMYFEPIQI